MFYFSIIKFWLLIWITCGGLTGIFLAVIGETGHVLPAILPLILIGYSIVGAMVGAVLYILIIKIFQKLKRLNQYLVILGSFCGIAGALTANVLYLGARPLQISIWGGIVGLFSVLIFNFRNKSVKDSKTFLVPNED